MKHFRQVSAFILAGGASSRMGQEKGLLKLGSEPLVLHTARLLEPLVAEVTIVGPAEHYGWLGLHTIQDRLGGTSHRQGPLAGIIAALEATSTPWNLILACDLPYVSAQWIEWFLSRALKSKKQVVMPRTQNGLEPLAAMYRRECAEPITKSFRSGVRKVTDALQVLSLDTVDAREWRKFDRDNRILKNMNTLQDFREARKWWEERMSQGNKELTLSTSSRRKRRAAPLPHK